MYSQRVVQWRIEAIEKALNIKVKETPTDKVQGFVSRLKAIFDENGQPLRGLDEEELRFIRDERVLSKCSFRYWADRYATMQKDGSVGGGVGRVKFWASQELALKKIAEIEEEQWDANLRGEAVDGVCVVMHKARQLGACLTGDAKVLMSDYTWKEIANVTIGDTIIATDENSSGPGVGKKLRKAAVIGTCSMVVPTHKIELEDGTIFRATPHHKFLCIRGTNLVWAEASTIKPGMQIRRVTVPCNRDLTFEDGWFGGLLDGEGSLRAKLNGGADICVSQVDGDVLEAAKKYLRDNGFKFRIETDNRKSVDSSKLGDKPVHKLVINRINDIFRLLALTRPKRFMDSTWYIGKELPTAEAWGTVVVSEPSIVQRVYDIQTTTATYIAEGYVSHNTALSRILLCHRLTNYRHMRGMAASVDDDKIMELYDRDKLCIDNLPFYLKPSVGYDVKAEHLYFDKLDSRILYQQSRQQSGLGQGRQFDLAHLTECAFWPYPNMIELDFFPTLPLGINTLCILESTANGLGGWWYDFTEDVRKGLQRRWRYIFAPWYIEPKKNRVTPPANWTPADITMQHARKVYETSRQFVGRDVLLEKDQLYWYETERAAALRRGKLNLFLTNYCATPEESFQHTGNSQFSVETLEYIRNNTIKPHYYEVTINQ
jgi:hypothetical protein